MANRQIGRGALPVTLSLSSCPKAALLALLSDVRTIEQSNEWLEDWKASRHLLTFDDQVQVAVLAGFRRVEISRGVPLKEVRL